MDKVVVINGIEYQPVARLSGRVIVRCRNAGVHVGTLVSRESGVVKLANANRLWSWNGAFTLSEVAMRGVSSARIACQVPFIDLTESDVCEVIPVADGVVLEERS